MKVNFKRVATAALAVAMSLSLAVPAFAAGNGDNKTLIVTGDTLDNKKVYAVQMFDAHVTEGANNTFDNYEMVNSEKWMEFFKTGADQGGVGLTDLDKDSNIDADDARAYLEKLTSESTEVKTFADKAQAWVRGHAGDFEVIASDSEDPAVADKETFGNLKPGYYLVYPEGGSTGKDSRGTDAMLVNVPRDNDAVLNMKSTFPTVVKKVDTNITEEDNHGDATDNGSAQVGDVVTFTLTSAVPDMSDYEDFYFAFNDTLSNGLQVVKNDKSKVEDGDDRQIDSLTVTIDGEKVSGYTVSLHDNVLKVEFTNLKNVEQANQPEDIGKDIVVTYKAMITEAAVVGTPALNTVKVEYSNDPTTGTTGTKGESTPDTSTVYTYDIDVNKWAAGPDGKKGTEDDIANLAGAEFILSTNATAPTAEQIAGDYAGYTGLIKLVGSGKSYRVAKPDAAQANGYETGAVDSFLTTDSGDITISGLEGSTEPGTTYYLHEVKAPDGYNKLKDPVEIVIEITNMDNGAATITVNNGNVSGDDGNIIDVENKKGIELPETGSIGTIGLTALGVVVVVAGLFAFPRKKKNRQD